MEELDEIMRTELGQLTPHQQWRLAEHHRTAAVQAWMAAVKEKRRKKKRRKKKLPKSGRRLLPLSARFNGISCPPPPGRYLAYEVCPPPPSPRPGPWV